MTRDSTLTKKILAIFAQYPEIQLCILYGSFASGQATQQSDVDLGIASDQLISAEKRIEISLLLSKVLGREVDLVDLRSASGLLLREILTKGRILLKKDTEIYTHLLKKHLYDQADFMPLLEMILKRRRERFIHGS